MSTNESLICNSFVRRHAFDNVFYELTTLKYCTCLLDKVDSRYVKVRYISMYIRQLKRRQSSIQIWYWG